MSKWKGDRDVVQRCFVLPNALSVKELMARADSQAAGLPSRFTEIHQAFAATLARLNRAAILPYRMAWIGEAHVNHERIQAAAAIQALERLTPGKDDLTKQAVPLRDQITDETFRRFLKSEEGAKALEEGAVDRLAWSAGLGDGYLARAGEDLLLQSVTVAWAAVETFCTDTIRAVLNERPNDLKLLAADEDAKRRISKTKWNLLELLDLGLDLTASVGDVVLSENDLSDQASLKAVLLPLFGSPDELRAALASSDLYTLNKLRNVLAHRGGVADAKFERETAGRWKAGALVSVTVQDLGSFVRAITEVVVQTLSALRRTYGLPPV